jgi:hypothetical protein
MPDADVAAGDVAAGGVVTVGVVTVGVTAVGDPLPGSLSWPRVRKNRRLPAAPLVRARPERPPPPMANRPVASISPVGASAPKLDMTHLTFGDAQTPPL